VRYAVVFALAGLLWGATPAAACDCDRPDLKEGLERSVAVFSGKVTKIVEDKEANRKTITFEVEKVWKGDVKKTVNVTTAFSGDSCGFDFAAKGEDTFLVFAKDDGKAGWSTDICTRTAALKSDGAKEDLEALGEGQPPGDEDERA
jgi:hypothetical protein